MPFHADDFDPELIGLKQDKLWPTTLTRAWYPRAAEDKEALVALARRLEDEGERWGIAERAKHGLFESPPDFFSHPEAEGLMQFVGGLIAALFEKDVSFPESWCHITRKGGYHDAHAHADFARHGVCGVYYVQTAECTVHPPSGIHRFYNPNAMADSDVVDVAADEGRLLLFPGWVRHAALPYWGEEERIVISFNARLERPEEHG